jgi:hypothetical protein
MRSGFEPHVNKDIATLCMCCWNYHGIGSERCMGEIELDCFDSREAESKQGLLKLSCSSRPRYRHMQLVRLPIFWKGGDKKRGKEE